MKDNVKSIAWRVLRSIPLSIAISSGFMFIHVAFFYEITGADQWQKTGIVHEDFYGGILFAFLFVGFVLFPLPVLRFNWILLIVRSVIFTAAIVFCQKIIFETITIPSGFHVDNFLIIEGLALLGSFLLINSLVTKKLQQKHSSFQKN